MACKKEEAIIALLTHRTLEEAAHAVNVSTNTLLRWQKEPEFDPAYRAAKRGFCSVDHPIAYLSSAAVSTFGKIMLDLATPPATRVRAADNISDHTAKAIEDVEARVAALEQAAGTGTTRL